MKRLPRPTRPALSRDYLLDQALGLIDRDGLGAFTMRKLGAEAGADPMAVYHYFPNKAALFDGVVETVYLDVSGPPLAGPPQERVMTMVRALRQAFLRHPEALPLVATRPANTPAVATLVEGFLAVLEEAGLSRGLALDAVTCLTVFTIGHALAQAVPPQGGDSPPTPFAEGFPRLSAALAESMPYDPDRQFDRGLKALVDGLIPRV